jgi:hypothetical protein
MLTPVSFHHSSHLSKPVSFAHLSHPSHHFAILSHVPTCLIFLYRVSFHSKSPTCLILLNCLILPSLSRPSQRSQLYLKVSFAHFSLNLLAIFSRVPVSFFSTASFFPTCLVHLNYTKVSFAHFSSLILLNHLTIFSHVPVSFFL